MTIFSFIASKEIGHLKLPPAIGTKNQGHTVVIGAGMAGLAAAISLAAKGIEVTLLESRPYSGGKMRTLDTDIGPVDSGPTVFTMKYVFERLFSAADKRIEDFLELEQASILARHAWNAEGTFDLFANREQSTASISDFFDSENAKGYEQFCKDAEGIFKSLKDNFIGAQQPGPFELGNRIGLTKVGEILNLRPFQTLWSALGNYFPDPRLRQLFGRYSTYVGSSPFQTPATLMLIAHVEQEGVWFVKGGMHKLAQSMEKLASKLGVNLHKDGIIKKIDIENGKIIGAQVSDGNTISADQIVYCGDISNLRNMLSTNQTRAPKPVLENKRSLSAITWSSKVKANGYPLHHHNVLFSDDYKREFDEIFANRHSPKKPTVYICAQDRHDCDQFDAKKQERVLCLINAPANGDHTILSEKDLQQCQENMTLTLQQCGLNLELQDPVITQPSNFNQLFPGSGGALYGRASHGWMASFARPGAKTKIPGLYLAGGSVHPGPGVPMATLSGMLAAEQICTDLGLT